MDIKCTVLFFPFVRFCPTGFFRLKVFNEAVEARPNRLHNYGSSKGECYGIISGLTIKYMCLCNILINMRIFIIDYGLIIRPRRLPI